MKPSRDGRPVDRPFDLAGFAEFFAEIHRAGKGLVGVGGRGSQRFLQVIGQATGKVERGLCGVSPSSIADFQRISTPENR